MFDPVSATVGAVGLGSGLVSGYMSKRASDKAANAQSASADKANDLQYQMWREQQALLSPYAQSGTSNLARLNYAMYGQMPSTASMELDPYSTDYQNYFEQNPGSTAETLYQNPLTGEISETPYNLSASDMGVEAGSLLDNGYTTEDWMASPEYQVYNTAQNAALTKSQDAINASAAAKGMYGSGTWADQLNTNMGNLYAQYQPASLAAARNADTASRIGNYNMISGLSNSSGARQLANAASNYGVNSGSLITQAGNAQAQGQLTGTNAMIGGISSGLNQMAGAYGNYQGQQNINALLAQLAAKTGSSAYNPYGQMNNSGWAFNL